MRTGVNLTEEEAKAFQAQKEQEPGAGWCVDVYNWQGRPFARAYQGKRGPKAGTKYRCSSEQRQGGKAARTAVGATSQQTATGVNL